jgi:putative hydrolase of the HAD superfamily
MIRAVTFDFWDTLAVDDSDEPKRAALGLPTKAQARLQLLMDEVLRHHPEVPPQRIAEAFEHANQRFRHRWKNEHVTPRVAERLQEAYAFLGIDLTPGFAELVRDIEEMEVRIPPDCAPGAREALAALARRYKLGLISDTIHTPGRGILQLLDRWGLRDYFECFVFSDEVGASKPAAIVFEQAAARLEVPLSAIVHVGDRESNDVAGAQAVGMRAILYTGIVDRGSHATRADAVCTDLTELPELVSNLQSRISNP